MKKRKGGLVISESGQRERLELIYDQEKAFQYRTVLDIAYSKTHHSNIVTALLRSICPKEPCKDFHVLDLGCGTGRYFNEFLNAGSVTGIDISCHMIKEAKQRLDITELGPDFTLQQADILEYHVPKQSFDLIVSIGTLGEYCPLTPKVVKDISEGLRPGGFAVFSVFDASHCLKTRLRAFYRKEPLAMMFDAADPLVPSMLRKTYSRLFYSHYLHRRELERLMAEQDGVHVKIGQLACPRKEWDGTHLVALMCKQPVTNEGPISKFHELLGQRDGRKVHKNILGIATPTLTISLSELEHIMAMFSESGVF